MNTTVAEYAKSHSISVSAARARLQKLVYAGKATRRTGFDQVQYGKATRGLRQPPPYIVITYTIDE